MYSTALQNMRFDRWMDGAVLRSRHIHTYDGDDDDDGMTNMCACIWHVNTSQI